MGKVRRDAYLPDEAAPTAYDALFAEYLALHDHFGRGDDVMHRLRRPRRAEAAVEQTPSPSCGGGRASCTPSCRNHGLVVWTSGQRVGAGARRGAHGHQAERRGLRGD